MWYVCFFIETFCYYHVIVNSACRGCLRVTETEISNIFQRSLKWWHFRLIAQIILAGYSLYFHTQGFCTWTTIAWPTTVKFTRLTCKNPKVCLNKIYSCKSGDSFYEWNKHNSELTCTKCEYYVNDNLLWGNCTVIVDQASHDVILKFHS